MSKDVSPTNRDRFIELGIKIAALRKMSGMSQEQLAAEAKMSRSHLSSIEVNNPGQNPSPVRRIEITNPFCWKAHFR